MAIVIAILVVLGLYLPYAIKRIWWDTNPKRYEHYLRFRNKRVG
jgi:preprotein translocase subunit Sec63